MKIRKAEISDAEAILKVSVETWHTVYKNVVPDELLAKKNYTPERVENWRLRIKETLSGASALYVVENDAGKVVGFVWGGASRDGNVLASLELYAIYVLPEYHKQGYGRALLEVFHKYAAGNFYLFALKDNYLGKGFYTKMGGVRKAEYDRKFEIYGVPIDEICFFYD